MGGNENYPPNYIIRDEQKHEGHVTVINLQKCRCMNKIAYTYARVEQELLLVTFPKRLAVKLAKQREQVWKRS